MKMTNGFLIWLLVANLVAAAPPDGARNPGAQRQIGVGGVHDSVHVRLLRDVALADFDAHGRCRSYRRSAGVRLHRAAATPGGALSLQCALRVGHVNLAEAASRQANLAPD